MLLLTLCLLLPSGFALAADADARVETRRYHAASWWTEGGCPLVQGYLSFQQWAETCFVFRPDETTFSIEVRDAAFAPISAAYYMNGGEWPGTHRHFCGSSGVLPIPADATRLWVYADLSQLPGECGLLPGARTAGTVAVTFG